jgi:fermentation-respiration switch protein FrsA (DUF1100 family)
VIRWLALPLWLTAVLVFLAAPARADLGGAVPSPGNCDYPAVGNWGLDGPGVYHWVCDFPTEVNGAHHHCQAGGAATNITLGVSFMFVNASMSTPTGVMPGICYWACPDLSVSEPPNPPGAWKSYIRPAACKTVAPNPLAPPPPPEPPGPGDPGYIYQPPANNLDPTLPNPDNTTPPGR